MRNFPVSKLESLQHYDWCWPKYQEPVARCEACGRELYNEDAENELCAVCQDEEQAMQAETRGEM